MPALMRDADPLRTGACDPDAPRAADAPAASAIAPHPVISDYYHSSEDRPQAVRDLFDAAAPAYDRITALMSFGTGAPYRRAVLRRIGVGPGAVVLDVACGTGQVATAASRLVAPTGHVIGVDPSPGMRDIARKQGITVQPGTAEALPIPDQSVDFVTMGYALRHVTDLVAAFREMRRVLKPGGTVCALEITPPAKPLARALLRFYLKTIIPPVSFLATANRHAARLMSYYWQTIEQCVPPQDILTAMKHAGFPEPTRSITAGIFSEYIATRSAPGRPPRHRPTHADRLLSKASPRVHRIGLAFGRHVQRRCLRITVLHPQRLNAPECLLIAPTHVGNLEPYILSSIRDKPVHWMTRLEFYRHPLAAWWLRKFMTFPVKRRGVPVSAIRCASELIERGSTVGIFPEGEVARGDDSMMHGRSPMGGVCVVSMRTGVPVVPVAVLGTETLNTLRPWIPFRRGRIWIAVGEPVEPPPHITRRSRRALRHDMINRLGRSYIALRAELDALDDPP